MIGFIEDFITRNKLGMGKVRGKKEKRLTYDAYKREVNIMIQGSGKRVAGIGIRDLDERIRRSSRLSSTG